MLSVSFARSCHSRLAACPTTVLWSGFDLDAPLDALNRILRLVLAVFFESFAGFFAR